SMVEVTCHPALPAVWADHDRLEQVFVNLLDNALRHNPPGTRVSVTAGTGQSGEIVVAVSDDGAGLPPDLAAAPFEPKRRGHSASAGAGLGLSIAQGIVAAHAGQIRSAGTRKGTSFEIRLPVEAPDRADGAGGTTGATNGKAGGATSAGGATRTSRQAVRDVAAKRTAGKGRAAGPAGAPPHGSTAGDMPEGAGHP
ncbi:MAG TPA: HAMP domain-containing sensor histidine kinase, partial [Streptosporangiaceae bacterium]